MTPEEMPEYAIGLRNKAAAAIENREAIAAALFEIAAALYEASKVVADKKFFRIETTEGRPRRK